MSGQNKIQIEFQIPCDFTNISSQLIVCIYKYIQSTSRGDQWYLGLTVLGLYVADARFTDVRVIG